MKTVIAALVVLALSGLARAGASASLQPKPCTAVEASRVPRGSMVSIQGVVVTATFPDFFYVESEDRVAGICVAKPGHTLIPGDRVGLVGVIGTGNDGERYVMATTVTVVGRGPVISPLGMVNQSLGGWSWRWVRRADGQWIEVWQPYDGLPATGLLVRVWGRVTKADPSGTYLFIDDGSHLSDYAETHTGVKVLASSSFDPQLFPVGTYVSVVGPSSVYKDEITGDPLPLIRIANQSSITSY